MKTFGCVAVVLLLAVGVVPAASPVVDFDSLSDGDVVTTQIPGAVFSHAAILTAGISLNEFEFPPASGANVLIDDGAPIQVSFPQPIHSFRGRFTYGMPLHLQAFDAGGNLVASSNSRFASNLALSGDSGSAPNEIVTIATGQGISSLTITADPAGSSVALDNVETDFDNIPPTTTASETPGLNPAGWQNHDVTVQLAALDNDGGVGVQQIVVAASGAQTVPSTAFSGSSASIVVSAEGTTTISYFSTDAAGNSELPQQVVVRIDKTAPTTAYTATSAANAAGWYNRDVTLQFNASDAGIGGQQIVLSASGAQVLPPSTSIGPQATLTLSAEGDTTVTYFAQDALGNAETPKTVLLRLDKTAPEVFTQFDLATFDIQMFGQDAGSGTASGPVVPVSVVRRDWEDDDLECGPTRRGEIRTYRVSDRAGNTTTVVEHVHPHHGDDPHLSGVSHAVRARLISLQYGTAPSVTLPLNRERFAWEFVAGGAFLNIVQRDRWGGGENLHEVVARWNPRRNETVIRTLAPLPESETSIAGLTLLRMSTDKGGLVIRNSIATITLHVDNRVGKS